MLYLCVCLFLSTFMCECKLVFLMGAEKVWNCFNVLNFYNLEQAQIWNVRVLWFNSYIIFKNIYVCTLSECSDLVKCGCMKSLWTIKIFDVVFNALDDLSLEKCLFMTRLRSQAKWIVVILKQAQTVSASASCSTSRASLWWNKSFELKMWPAANPAVQWLNMEGYVHIHFTQSTLFIYPFKIKYDFNRFWDAISCLSPVESWWKVLCSKQHPQTKKKV